jgi:hypothetical protein
VKRAAEAMKTAEVNNFGGDQVAMLNHFNGIFQEPPKANNLSGFIEKLQQRGYIAKKTRQSRKVALSTANNSNANNSNDTSANNMAGIVNNVSNNALAITINVANIGNAADL